MMRKLLLLAALLGPCCSLQPGLEYQYRYSGRVATSMTKTQNYFSVVGIQAEVILQVINTTTIKVKIINIQSGGWNEVTMEHLQDPNIQYHAMKPEDFVQPFAINIAEGELESLVVPTSDNVYKNNIRHSVVNPLFIEHLKVNFAGAEDISHQNTIKDQTPFTDGPFFAKKGENSLFGKCLSLYKITALPEDLAKKEALVSKKTISQDVQDHDGASNLSTKYWAMKKTTEFKRCEKKNYGLRDGTPTGCKFEEVLCEPNIEKSSVGSYVLRGDSNGIRIERVSIEGSITFHATVENSASLNIFTNQTLILTSVSTIAQEIDIKTPVKTVHQSQFEYTPSLKSKYGAIHQQHLEEFVSAFELDLSDFTADAKNGISKAIKKIVELYNDLELALFLKNEPTIITVRDKISCLLKIASKPLSILHMSDLKDIHIDIDVDRFTDLSNKRMTMFLDLLMMSGSEPSIRYLMELIEASYSVEQRDYMFNAAEQRTYMLIKFAHFIQFWQPGWHSQTCLI